MTRINSGGAERRGMPSPNSLAAIDAAARVLLARAEEIVAACAMTHPAAVVGVVPRPEDDAVRIHPPLGRQCQSRWVGWRLAASTVPRQGVTQRAAVAHLK